MRAPGPRREVRVIYHWHHHCLGPVDMCLLGVCMLGSGQRGGGRLYISYVLQNILAFYHISVLAVPLVVTCRGFDSNSNRLVMFL